MEVEQLLFRYNLMEYVQLFRDNDLSTVAELASLSPEDWKELIPKMGPRKRLMTAVSSPSSSLPLPPSVTTPSPSPSPFFSTPHVAPPPPSLQNVRQEIQVGYFANFTSSLYPSVPRPEPSIAELYEMRNTVPEDAMVEVGKIEGKFDIYGCNVPEPIGTFEEVLAPDCRVLANLRRCGYRHPTAVQRYALSCCANARDFLASSQTGSGKTAAFLLPILATLEKVLICTNFQMPHPIALILSPTRELAIQTYTECRKFADGIRISMVCLVGGEPAVAQLAKIRDGAHIWHATPGRLIDLLRSTTLNFRTVRYLVLDEADHMMLDNSNAMNYIMHPEFGMPHDRQTLMFAATIPPGFSEYVKRIMHSEVMIRSKRVIADTIKHIILLVEPNRKLATLVEEIQKVGGRKKMLIFVNHKASVASVAEGLANALWDPKLVGAYKADLSNLERPLLLDSFRKGRVMYIETTAVLARGLDIEGLDHVVCYDLPETLIEYIHRVGRVGRMGRPGFALSFFNRQQNWWMEQQLLCLLKENGQQIPTWMEHTVEVGDTDLPDPGDLTRGSPQPDAGHQWPTASSSSPPPAPQYSAPQFPGPQPLPAAPAPPAPTPVPARRPGPTGPAPRRSRN